MTYINTAHSHIFYLFFPRGLDMVFCFLEKKIRNIIFLFLDISILCTFHQFPCLTRSRGFCTCVRLCECVYFIYLSYICAFWNISNQKTNHRLCNWAAFFPSLSPSFEWLDLSYVCRLNGCIQSMQWNTCHAMRCDASIWSVVLRLQLLFAVFKSNVIWLPTAEVQ